MAMAKKPVNKKWLVAKVIGGTAVGATAFVVLKKGFGAAVAGSTIGSLFVMGAHEVFDAPVSGWVYKQL